MLYRRMMRMEASVLELKARREAVVRVCLRKDVPRDVTALLLNRFLGY